MKILFISPIPPPITGQALASLAIFNKIENDHVILVNLSVASVYANRYSFARLRHIFRCLVRISKWSNNVDSIYFTISESFFGNIKDLIIYILCYNRLNSMTVHLHGGSFKRDVLDKNRFLKNINIFFLRKVRNVIVSGPSHLQIFNEFISKENIHIVYNFFQSDLLLAQNNIKLKFDRSDKLLILYISSMQDKKGYLKLYEAFINLPFSIRENFELHFAGYFSDNIEENKFINRVNQYDNIYYHGVISHAEKVRLLSISHIVCLPTLFSEGQPLIILEAYASGCAVMATDQPGIRDIFNCSNGFKIENQAIEESIVTCLIEAYNNPGSLYEVAMLNNNLAKENYLEDTYVSNVLNLLSYFSRERVNCPIKPNIKKI